MKKLQKFLAIIFMCMLPLMLSCGGGGGGGGAAPDTTPPTVSSASPANNATGVAINTAITATFSEAMDASTITTSTFTLSSAGGPVIGTVTYSSTTATFTPSGNLSYSTTYTATITTGAKDSAGNTMASDYTWSFTTEATPPTVDVTGTWSGTYSTSLVPLTTVTLNLIQQAASTTSMSITYADKSTKRFVQTAANVTGTFITPDVEGTVNGTISGNTITFTLNQTTASCLGTFSGTATVTDNTMTFTFTGSDCLGTHTDGQGTATKQVQAINAPTSLTTTAISTTQINLSWTDNSNNEELFAIERKTGSGGTYSQIATVGADVTTYSDTGLTANTTYYYRVRAYSTALGYSGYSNEASATTQAGGTIITDGSFSSSSSSYEIRFVVVHTLGNMIDNLYVEGCGGSALAFSAGGLGLVPITNSAFTFHDDGTTEGATYSVDVSGTFTDNNHANGTYSFSWSYQGTCTKVTAWSATRQ